MAKQGPAAKRTHAPVSLLGFFEALEKLSIAMALASGAILTALAFFIAIDVIGRSTSSFYSGATDEIAGFAMALAVTWALAYTLTIDKHVRVDLLLGAVPKPLRRLLDWIAMALLTAFAGLLARYSWALAIDSLEIGALSQSILQVPIGIPQAAMACGFSMLALQGLATLVVATLDPRGLERLRAREADAAPMQFDV
jgi:TRAP-type C4-dicarboxylate transport system permease small subunit